MLPEIRLALTRLWTTGETTVLDLRHAPLGPQAERRLFEALQRDLAVTPARQMGSCRIRETAAPCVWIVEHLNSAGDVTAKFIEVNWYPGSLKGAAELDDDGRAGPAADSPGASPSG